MSGPGVVLAMLAAGSAGFVLAWFVKASADPRCADCGIRLRWRLCRSCAADAAIAMRIAQGSDVDVAS